MWQPQRLLVLQAVIAAGSVNGAAKNLSYAPATVSQHLQALARETGLVLFTKSGRGIVPTAAALELADHGGVILADLDRFSLAVADLREGRAEQLAIACFSSVAQAWLPRVALALHAKQPGLTLEISLNEPAGGHGRRPADLDIRSEALTDSPVVLDGYGRCELATEEFCAIFPRRHRLAGRTDVAMADLREEPWIDHDLYDSPTGRIVTAACRAAGFAPRYIARLDDHHAALALVAVGVGIAVLPRLAVQSPPPGVVVVRIVRPTVARRIIAHTRRGVAKARLLSIALAELQKQATQPRAN